MVSLDFSRSGGNAFDDLSPEIQVAVIDKVEKIKDNPRRELENDTAYKHHYSWISVEDQQYIIVAKWDRVRNHVQIRNIGTPDQTNPL